MGRRKIMLEKQHQKLGLELACMQDRLASIYCIVANQCGKTRSGVVLKLIKQAAATIDLVRGHMEDIAFNDILIDDCIHGRSIRQKALLHCYYPNFESRKQFEDGLNVLTEADFLENI